MLFLVFQFCPTYRFESSRPFHGDLKKTVADPLDKVDECAARYSQVQPVKASYSLVQPSTARKVDKSGWKWMKEDKSGWKRMKVNEIRLKWMKVDECGWKQMTVDESGWNIRGATCISDAIFTFWRRWLMPWMPWTRRKKLAKIWLKLLVHFGKFWYIFVKLLYFSSGKRLPMPMPWTGRIDRHRFNLDFWKVLYLFFFCWEVWQFQGVRFDCHTHGWLEMCEEGKNPPY